MIWFKKAFAVLLLVATVRLLVSEAHATPRTDQLARRTVPAAGSLGFPASGCQQVGKAYATVNANRDIWITLSLGALTSGTDWCESGGCKLVPGIEYDTQATYNWVWSPTYRALYNNPNGGGVMTPGAMFGYQSAGSLCGGAGTECAGEWPGDYCVAYEELYSNEVGISAMKDWFASGYQTSFTFYGGKFGNRGTQSGDTCTGSDHGCNWFFVLVPVRVGSQTGYLEWDGFYEFVGGSGHPNCCNKECCQLVKPQGPGTPVQPGRWGTIKGLYK